MKQYFSSWIALFVFVALPQLLVAQRPALVPAPTPVAVDSTRQSQSAADTTPPTVQRNGRIGEGAAPRPIRVSTDPSSRPVLTPDNLSSLDTIQVTPEQAASIRKIIPRKATIRSLILPGLGQAYNRQYYKIPFIYGGFGVVGYFFVRYQRLSKEAENGYRLLLYGRPNGTPTNTPVTEVLIGDNLVTTTANAKGGYDFYRRYRDLNTILFAVLWAVNAVEANVAAHLKTFDLSDDISMRVNPAVIPLPGTGFAPGVRVALTFK